MGRDGGHKIGKWTDVGYGWPPSHLTFPSNSMAARGFWQAPGSFFFFIRQQQFASSCRRASPPGGARLLSERARAREWFKLSIVYSK